MVGTSNSIARVLAKDAAASAIRAQTCTGCLCQDKPLAQIVSCLVGHATNKRRLVILPH